jgi:replication-associated recombination protein RarA
MLDTSQFDPLSPKRIEDVVGNTQIWKETFALIKDNNISHIVLVGPAGSGKSVFLRNALAGFTTLVIDCTANFGLRDNRDILRLFARGSRSTNGNLRWIILEHADSLTADTQSFLRRMLETTSNTTRFVFECRDGGAITEPIYSRSRIITVGCPDQTEIMYELQRRTEYALDKKQIDTIVKYCFGNMRYALMQALAKRWCNIDACPSNAERIEALLSERSEDWIQWALRVESICKLEGIDLRDVLRIGWPNNTTVSNTCAQWFRLGGTSPRTLFFDCISSLLHAEKA